MKIKYSTDSLTLLPFLRDFQGYTVRSLRHDVVAAITVALLTLPTSMAYALAANLPPSVGIFASIFATIFAAGFGSSRHLVVGPTNTIAVLIQTGTATVLSTYYHDLLPEDRNILAVQVVIQLTFVVGILQLIAAALKLGKLTQFISRPVVLGYLVGAGFAIISSQIFFLLGISPLEGPIPIYEKVWHIIIHLKEIYPPTALVGAGSLLTLLILKRLNHRIPASAITLAAAGIVVYFLALSPEGAPLFKAGDALGANKVELISDFGSIHSLSIRAAPPFFDMHIMNILLPNAFAIAMLGVLEATSIGKQVASKSGQNLSINQEILGLGVGNIVASFFGAMPSSGSPSRSSLNYASGAVTHLSSMLCGLFVVALIFACGGLIGYIPLAALAALLIVTAFTIVDMKQVMLSLKATHSDATVLLLTVGFCVAFGPEIAFYTGVVLSIALHLKKASSPYVVEYSFGDSGRLQAISEQEKQEISQIKIIHVEGELFFGAVDLFHAALKAIAENEEVRVIILHLKNAHHMDATACLAVQQLHQYLQKSGRHLIASGLTPHVWKVLKNSGLVEELGEKNLFASNVQTSKSIATSTQQAFQRAKELISKG